MKLRPEPLLIGLACFGPMLLAALLYFGPLGGAGLPVLENPDRELLARAGLPSIGLETGHGEPAETPWASYRWSVIYVTRTPCGDTCRGELTRLQQVHDALAADRHRVRRVLLYAGERRPAVADGALLVGRLDSAREAVWRDLFGLDAEGGEGRFFVADPLGNLVVAYPAGADRKAMLEDLERLLDASGIG